MPNFKSVVHFLLVDFGGGCNLVVNKVNSLVLGLRLKFDKKKLLFFKKHVDKQADEKNYSIFANFLFAVMQFLLSG